MSLKSKFSKEIAKIVRFSLKLTGRSATALPGFIAYRLDKDILNELSTNTEFIFVTGTNGKTMTTHFLVNILRRGNTKVFTNDSGSNMMQGIITSLLDNPSHEKSIAVLEVDEANLIKIAKYINPKYVIFTNLFRDQTDRFVTVDNVYNKLIEAMKETSNSIILANGDLPIFNDQKIKEFDVKYFGIRDYRTASDDYDINAESEDESAICPKCGTKLKYRLNNYSSLGDYKCPDCDYKSPNLTYYVDKIGEISTDYSSFYVGDEFYEINLGGIYNIYNALAALSVAKEMKTSYEDIYEGLKTQQRISGRQENITINSKNVKINLMKNTTGLNQMIDLTLLEKEDLSLIFLLNDNYADGRDISRIYDTNIEKLKALNINDIYASGIRSKDMKKRLLKAELYNGEIREFDYENEIEDIIKNSKSDKVLIFSTYTAMLKLREVLGL